MSPLTRKRLLFLGLLAVLITALFIAKKHGYKFAHLKVRECLRNRNMEGAKKWLQTLDYIGQKHHPETLMLRARLCRLRGYVLQTSELLKLAQQNGASSEQVNFEWLMADAQSGSIEELYKHLSDVSDFDEQCEGRYALVSGLLSLRRYAEVESQLKFWTGFAPQDGRPWYLAGELCRARSQLEESLLAYRESVRLQPLWLAPRIAEAALLESMRRYEESLSVYETLPEEGDDAGAILLGKAYTLLDLGKDEEAERVARLLDHHYPGHYNAAILIARCREAREDFEGVVKVLLPLISRYPKDLDLNLRLSQAYLRLDNHQESERHALAYSQGQGVMSDFEQQRAKLPQHANDPDYYLSLAEKVIPYRFQDAEPLLETAASLQPLNPRSYELLATIAGRRADTEKVRDWEHVARKVREKISSQPSSVR